MTPLSRKTLFPTDILGCDSIQGVLEFAMRYNRNNFIMGFAKEEASQLNSLYSTIQRLAREGYLEVQWNSDQQERYQLDQIALTTEGGKLLAELQGKSKGGRFASKLSTIFWAVVTSAVTAYVVSSLALK
jgi:hypothetical protein